MDECFRVLKPGMVLSISDIPTERPPLGPLELLASITQMRVFGLRPTAAMTACRSPRPPARPALLLWTSPSAAIWSSPRPFS